MKNQDRKESFTKKAGDTVERAGQKIGGKIGKKVYDAGDKLEHSQDRKDVDRGVKRPTP